MPHRIQALHMTCVSIIEGTALSILAAYQLAVGLIDADSWAKITGQHGTLFILSIGVIVLWNAGRVREANAAKRDVLADQKSERQHAETLNLQKENSEKLMALQAESIVASLKSSNAIEDRNRIVDELVKEIRRIPFKCPNADIEP